MVFGKSVGENFGNFIIRVLLKKKVYLISQKLNKIITMIFVKSLSENSIISVTAKIMRWGFDLFNFRKIKYYICD